MSGVRAIGCFLLLAIVLAMPVAVRAGDSPARLAIVGATVFDGTGKRPIRADVLIEDGRIAALGREIEVPEGTAVIEAGGLALLPGLFDVHTHWTPAMEPSSSVLVSNAYLAAGVTTLSDFHQSPEAWQPRREWLSSLVAPRVLFAARMSTPLGHGADWADQATTKWVNSPEAARRAVRELLPYRPDVIKAFTDGWRYGRSAENTSMDGETLAALVEEAHAGGLRVLTHTVTVARARVAADAGVDVIAHSVLDARIDDATVAALRRAGTTYAPTLAVYQPVRVGEEDHASDHDDPVIASRRHNFANALHNVRKLHRGGVPIALGTDAGMTGTPHGISTLHELELLVAAGLSPAEALRAGTYNSARALGLDAELGTIAVGKRADLLLVRGEPWRRIADIRNTEQVFLSGVPVFPQAVPEIEQAVAEGIPNPGRWLPTLPLEGALLDDFERVDGRTALDTLRTGEADGGNDRTWQILQVVPREQGGHSLLVTAALSSKSEPYANLVVPLSRGSVAPRRVDGRTGIEFEVRGNAAAMALQLRGLERRQWQVDLPAPGDDWRTVRVELDGIGESTWRGEPKPDGRDWSAADPLLQLLLVAKGPGGAQIWYEVDNLRFY